MRIKNYIETLVEKGVKIDCIYDIGGWMGYWTENMSSGILNEKEFIVFEGNPYYQETLSRLNRKIKQTCLFLNIEILIKRNKLYKKLQGHLMF